MAMDSFMLNSFGRHGSFLEVRRRMGKMILVSIPFCDSASIV
jgi:hypothetical protein